MTDFSSDSDTCTREYYLGKADVDVDAKGSNGPLMSRSESGGGPGGLNGLHGGLHRGPVRHDGLQHGLQHGLQDGLRQSVKAWLGQNVLLLATLAGVACGVLLGLVLRPLQLHDDWVMLLSYPGELFMRLLKLMILPLVIASLIAGTSRMNARMNGRIAVRTLTYFAATSLLNAILGIALVLAIHPGDARRSWDQDAAAAALPQADPRDARDRAQVMDGLLDLGRNLFADNLFQAAFQQVHTVYVPKKNSEAAPSVAPTSPYPAVDAMPVEMEMERSLKFRDGTNTLGIIFFCMLFGTVLSTMGSKGRVVVDFFCTIYEVVMKMVSGIMWLTPVGVCSVICGKILGVADLAVVMSQLAWFILTVVIGVCLYQFLILQLIYYAFLRKNPYRFYAALFQANLTAFATASTAAALPISMRTLDRLGTDQRVTRFVLPIGCAVNMDGTALFISVATIFIAQINYMTLGWGDLATVCLTSTAASMSSASVPSAALVLLLMVLSTIGVPAGEASLLFAVDWFVDRVRTTNNCLGDLYAAVIVEHLSKAELESPDGEALNTAEFNGLGVFTEDGDVDLEAAMEKTPALRNGSLKK